MTPAPEQRQPEMEFDGEAQELHVGHLRVLIYDGGDGWYLGVEERRGGIVRTLFEERIADALS